MNESIRCVAVIFMIAFIRLNLFGQVPDKLPIGSYDELRAYCLEQARSVEVTVTSVSAVNDGSGKWYSHTPIQGGAGEIKDAADKAVVSLAVQNTLDPIHLSCYVLDATGQVLLSDVQKKIVVLGKGGYFLSDNSLELDYPDYLWLRIQGATHAEVGIVNQTPDRGETIQNNNLLVSEGKVAFPTALVGKANLRIWVGGVSYTYNLKGVRVEPEVVEAVASVTIKNTIRIVDGDVKIEVNSVEHEGENILVELELTKDRGVSFYGMTTEGLFATGCSIRKFGETTWVNVEIPKGFQISMRMAAGKYFIYFRWDPREFKEVERPYPTPESGAKG